MIDTLTDPRALARLLSFFLGLLIFGGVAAALPAEDRPLSVLVVPPPEVALAGAGQALVWLELQTGDLGPADRWFLSARSAAGAEEDSQLLSAALSCLERLSQGTSQRRMVDRYSGDLRAFVAAECTVSRSEGSDARTGSAGAAAFTGPIPLKAVSDGCARFYRNGQEFYRGCGFGDGRGINIAVLHASGSVEQIIDFDTWYAGKVASALAAAFLKTIPPGRIIMLGVGDANSLRYYPDSLNAFLQSLPSQCAAGLSTWDTWAAIFVASQRTSLVENCAKYASETGWSSVSAEMTLNVPPASDVTPPLGEVHVNGGAGATSSNLIELDLSSISDALGMNGGKMRFGDGTAWGPLIDYQPAVKWRLPRVDGQKTVHAEFRDPAGNWTEPKKINISLRETYPLRQLPDDSYYGATCLVGSVLYMLSGGQIRSSQDAGAHWAPPVRVFDGSDYSDNLLCSPERITALRFKTAKQTVTVLGNTSKDGGRSWGGESATSTAVVGTDYHTGFKTCAVGSNVVALWNSGNSGRNYLYALRSTDAGTTWDEKPVEVAQAANLNNGDYSLACNGSDVAVLVESQSNRIDVVRSANGGGAFGPITNVLSTGASDWASVSDASGRIYVFHAAYSSGGYELRVSISTDLGKTWAQPIAIARQGSYPDFTVAASDSGEAYVSWIERSSGSDETALRFAASRDRGMTWRSSTLQTPTYWTNFGPGERPRISDIHLTAGRNGLVSALWSDDRKGLGYTVARFPLSPAGSAAHEDALTKHPSETYLATSSDFGDRWTISTPLNLQFLQVGYMFVGEFTIAENGMVIVLLRSGSKNYIDARPISATAAPPILIGDVLHAATLLSGPIAPGMIAELTGYGLSDTSIGGEAPDLPFSLAGVGVTIADAAGGLHDAPLYSVSPGRIRFVVPRAVRPGSGELVLRGRLAPPLPIEVVPIAPGLFPAAPDGNAPAGWLTVSSPGNSVAITTLATPDGTPREIVIDSSATYEMTLLGTGFSSADAVKVSVGGREGSGTVVTRSAGWPGLDAVSCRIPTALIGAGEVVVRLVADGKASNDFRLLFR